MVDPTSGLASDVTTERLILHPIDEAEGRRIHDRDPSASDRWAEDYPFEGDIVAVGVFLFACARGGDQRPFGYYQIVRRSDGQAIGGIGFIGPPESGTVEIGYGLVPGARGQGYAAEAVNGLLAIAREHGVRVVRADTEVDNAASRRTLERAGFVQMGADGKLLHFQAAVAAVAG